MYLASHLDAEVLSMELSRNRLLLDPANRAEFCLALARKPVSISWPRLLARMLGLRGSREALVTMFEYLREGASRSTVFRWLAKAVPRVAEKSIQKVELALVSEDMTEGPSHPLHDVWWSPPAKRQYNNTAQCLERLHRRLGLRHRAEGGTTAALKRRDMVLRVQGLRLAYDALVESFGVATAGSEFRRLWPEAQAVFFARFCLLSCDVDQQGPKPLLSQRANCLLPLHNMPEFGTVFDCGSREDFVAEQCLA